MRAYRRPLAGRRRRRESGERERAHVAAHEVEHAHRVVVRVGDEHAVAGDREAARLAESGQRRLAVLLSWLTVAGDRPTLRGGGVEPLDLVVVSVGDQERARVPGNAEGMLKSHFGRPGSVAIT